jgi:hypothetical protein
MKVTITNLKAPWPAGAGLGSIVEFEGKTAPAWAVGKFDPAPDDLEASFRYEPAPPAENVAPGPVPGFEKLSEKEREEISAGIHRIREEAHHRAAEAEGKAGELAAENATLREQLAAAAERIAALEAEKAKVTDVDAQADAEKARLALEAEAKELGVSFHPNLGDDKLRERIAEARAKK